MMNSAGPTIQESRSDRILLGIIYVSLLFVFIIVAYPLIYIVSSSLSSSEAVLAGKVWLWPVEPTLYGYEATLIYPQIWVGFRNTIIYTICGSLLSVSLTVMLAYPISQVTFVGRKLIIFLLLFALIFNGGLIPFYLVVKNLGMIDTIWAMIVPAALNIFSVIVAKTFFQATISKELYEAASIDGCGDARFLLQIVLPLSKPILAVLTLWSAVGIWNSYFNAMIFLGDKELFPLQLALREILVLNNVSMQALQMSAEQLKKFNDMKTLLKYSTIVTTCIPILLLYPVVQKYFVQGVMIGSVKE
jgi:putative aldouronate transport system permease protein